MEGVKYKKLEETTEGKKEEECVNYPAWMSGHETESRVVEGGRENDMATHGRRDER